MLITVVVVCCAIVKTHSFMCCVFVYAVSLPLLHTLSHCSPDPDPDSKRHELEQREAERREAILETERLELEAILEAERLEFPVLLKEMPSNVMTQLKDLSKEQPEQIGIYNASQAHVEEKLARFKQEGRDHLEVKPVYLGFIPEYRNLRKLISSVKMKDMIVERFKNMQLDKYDYDDLKYFFEPSKKGGGFTPKMVKGRHGQTHIMFDVDHVVPQSWGGIHHPRNYVIMHRSMNRSFQSSPPERKMAYLGADSAHSRSTLRKVCQFTTDIFDSRTVRDAIVQYIQKEMQDW